jgi:hypothetical protein
MMRDRLLSGPRTIVRDLIDKRLWPVAIALLVALVAVPIVLGGSGGTAPVAPLPAPVPAQAGADTAIKVSAPAVLGHSRPGPVDDPFYAPPKPKVESSGPTTSSPSSSSSSSSSAPGSTKSTDPGTGGTTPPTTTEPSATPSTDAASYVFYRPRVRFGADDAAPVRGLSRLEPLGGQANPAALYLGPTANHTHAVFLLGPNAVATGAGACGETTCRVFALKAGESATIQVIGASGYMEAQYVLTLDKIAEQPVADEATLLAMRGRVHADGRDVLRTMILDRTTAAAVGKLTYNRRLGAVVLTDTL